MTTRFAYIHCRPDGTPFYVGKGSLRRARHFGARNPHYRCVAAKYGVANLLYGVMECSDDDTAFALEVGLIKCLRRANAKITNRTSGGEGARDPSPETRQKLSEAAKKRGVSVACQKAKVDAKRGKPLTDKHKELLRAQQLGRVFTEEHRKNISVGAKRRGVLRSTIEAAHSANRGRVQSAEERYRRGRSIAETLRKKGRTTVVAVGGVRYDSLRAAADIMGVCTSAVWYGLNNSGYVKGHKVERVP
jgi:hypothetical protein